MRLSPAPSPTPCAKRFDFRRLGLRTSAMLISPWIPKGTVFQEPKGPYNTSQFELTSVLTKANNDVIRLMPTWALLHCELVDHDGTKGCVRTKHTW